MNIKEKSRELAKEFGLKHDGERITSPGKFEAEQLEVLYFYEAYLNGDGESFEDEILFELTDEERDEIGAKYYAIEFFGDGFVTGFKVSEDQYKILSLTTNEA